MVIGKLARKYQLSLKDSLPVLLRKICSKYRIDTPELNHFFENLDGFETEALREAFKNFLQDDSKLKINNLSFTLREVITNYLRLIAPNDKVEDTSWYRDRSLRNGEAVKSVSRQDRVKYIIQKAIANDILNEIDDSLLSGIESCADMFNKSYNVLNKYTHVSEKYFNCSDEIVRGSLKDIFTSLCNIDSSVKHIQNKISKSIESYSLVSDELHSLLVYESIDELSICSTHYLVEDAEVYSVNVKRIEHDAIYFEGEGEVHVEQQYGSSGDVSRGDGWVTNDSFPISFSGKISCLNFSEIEIDSSVDVNNDHHFGVGEYDTRGRLQKYIDSLRFRYWSTKRKLDVFYKRFKPKKPDEDDFDF